MIYTNIFVKRFKYYTTLNVTFPMPSVQVAVAGLLPRHHLQINLWIQLLTLRWEQRSETLSSVVKRVIKQLCGGLPSPPFPICTCCSVRSWMLQLTCGFSWASSTAF